MIPKAIYDVIVADAGVTVQLGTYDFGIGPKPSVFTSRVIPDDAERTAIRIEQVTAIPWGTRDARGAEIWVDVNVWGDKVQSDKALIDLANDVWRLLDRVDLTVTGYVSVLCQADAPESITDADGFPGYVVKCRTKIIE